MKRLAYVFVISAAVLWGTIGIYSNQLSQYGANVLQIVSIRAIFAALAIFVFILLKDIKLLNIDIHDWKYFFGTGILSFVFFNWCYFTAIDKTTLSTAAILLYTAPAIVMVFSIILFKEKLTRRKVAALILTFIGCAFVTGVVKGSQDISPLGILAGLGSGFGYALYSVFGRYALKKYDPITVTLYTFVFASIGLIPISDIKGLFGLLSSTVAFYNAVLLGLAATVMPFLLYTKGLSYLETSKASIIAAIEPVVATIIGIILFGEPITVFKIMGVFLVVFAVSILEQKKS